jgi:hypothetical protein
LFSRWLVIAFTDDALPPAMEAKPSTPTERLAAL